MFPTPHRVTISRETQTASSTHGGLTKTFANVSSGVACFIQQGAGFESIRQSRNTGGRTFTVYFRAGVDVRSVDRLVPEPGSPHAGRVLVVDSPDDVWTGIYTGFNATLEDGGSA
jgi:regulator of RNase E activity RraA